MLKLLPALLPWWLSGPGLGLCVAALYGLANRRLGSPGAGWRRWSPRSKAGAENAGGSSSSPP